MAAISRVNEIVQYEQKHFCVSAAELEQTCIAFWRSAPYNRQDKSRGGTCHDLQDCCEKADGHPDTAEGASLSVVVAPLTRGRIPTIVKHVNTVVTPGEVVDVVVTEQGIAVNPRRPDLKEKIEAAGLHVFTIEQLQQRAEMLVGVPDPIRYKDRIVGVVMYRDNTIIDVVHEIDEDA